MRDLVVDDKMNYKNRKPSSVDNKILAEMDMITRRISVAETTSDADTDSQSLKCLLHESKEMSGRNKSISSFRNANKYKYEVLNFLLPPTK